MYRAIGLLLSLLMLSSISSAQNPASPQVTVPKDPTAVQLLTAMAAASGWTPTAIPPDLMASAVITRVIGTEQDTINATLKYRGNSQFAGQYVESGTTTKAFVNGRTGMLVNSDNKVIRVRFPGSLGLRPPIFPFLTDVDDWATTTVALQYLGTRACNGDTCAGVRIARVVDPTDVAVDLQTLRRPISIWISTTTQLPVALEYVRQAADNPYVLTHYTRLFSDYRQVNGLSIAFQQEERVEGQPMYRIQLTSVEFNAGLADTDFVSTTR